MRRVAVAIVAIAAFVTVVPTRASALGTGLGGYQGSAAGSGLQVDYTPQGALPLPSLVDIGSPDAVATISSGPSTYAQSSVLDPGDLLANPDALLTLALGAGYPSGTIPAYPYRIAANSGFGEPKAESDPAPGLHAEVDAEPDGSTARAATAQASGAPIAIIGSLSALATTHTDGDTVTVHSLTKVSGLSVLRLLNVDSVITDLTATSKGNGTKLSGTTKVLGATFGGRPVTIDATGVHLGKNALPIPKSLGSSLNDALKRAGLHITVSGPTPLTSESSGRLASGGLRIDFDNTTRNVPALTALFAAFPPVPNPAAPAPSVADILVAIQAHDVAGIELARGVVSLAARQAGVFDDTSGDDSFVPSLGGDLGGYDIPTDVSGVDLVPRQPAPVLGVTRPAGATANALSPFGVGIGGLLLVALLLQPFLGQALARVSNGLLTKTGAEHCDQEDR